MSYNKKKSCGCSKKKSCGCVSHEPTCYEYYEDICYNGCKRCNEKDPLLYDCNSKKDPLLYDCNCQKEALKCEEEIFDAKQVRYKIDCDNYSNLSNLGIKKGDNLEYIIDKIGKAIESLDYVDTPIIEGHPEINSWEKLVKFFIDNHNSLVSLNAELREDINTLHCKYDNLEKRVKELEYPKLQDTSAIGGFTKYSSLQEVIQQLINVQ